MRLIRRILGFIGSILDRRFQKKIITFQQPLQKVQSRFSDMLRDHVKDWNGDINYRYSLEFVATRRAGWWASYPNLYWDTKLGFVLYVKDVSGDMQEKVPIAMIGFEKDSTCLFVRQVQGVEGKQKYLAPLYWEKLLYRVVILLARRLNLQEVRVPTADKSPYHPFANPEASEHLTFPQCQTRAYRLHFVYEVIPKHCGFKWRDEVQAHTFVLL